MRALISYGYALEFYGDLDRELFNPKTGSCYVEREYPDDPRPPHLAGVILAGQDKWEEAVQELERSLSLRDDPSARYSAAVIYRYHLRQEEKAKKHFDMAARLCEDPALASMIKAELDK